MGPSHSVLDARQSVLMYSTSQLWDASRDTVYLVADLHTKDVAYKGLWILPHQVVVGEPGEDHSQGWGVGHCRDSRERLPCRRVDKQILTSTHILLKCAYVQCKLQET